MHTTRLHASWTAAVLLGLAARASAQLTQAVWDGASGLTPDRACPAWTLVDTAAGADPVLSNGVLTLSTAANAQDMFYMQTALTTPLPDPLVIEARVKFDSGESSLGNRGPVAFAITTAPNAGSLFFVGAGQIFLTGAGDVRGPSAAVDTQSAFHVYHIEITAAGAVTVSYDGTPKLTGATYSSVPAFGPVPRILWGEGSIVAFGTEEWSSFRHNAATCDGATTTLAGTTSTTTTTVAGATTTLPPGECDDAAPGTLAAVRCRLDILSARISGDNGLGALGPKLAAMLTHAVTLNGQADAACIGTDAKTASRRMKQVQKLLQNMGHRLRGLSARKHVDTTLRTDLLQIIGGIRDDALGLRHQPCG